MIPTSELVSYPDADGKPMADNTRQFESIVYIKKGCDWLFSEDPTVFVAGDLLWYPIEGNNKLCQAPDTMIVFGRPKGDPCGICEAARGSYQQWKEDNIPPQVVFEVISPSNTIPEMTRKFQFYDRYGIEEYYIYDPDRSSLGGFVRQGNALEAIEEMEGWISPRLQVRFGLSETGSIVLDRPDEKPFETYEQVAARADAAEQEVAQLRARLKAMGVDLDNAG